MSHQVCPVMILNYSHHINNFYHQLNDSHFSNYFTIYRVYNESSRYIAIYNESPLLCMQQRLRAHQQEAGTAPWRSEYEIAAIAAAVPLLQDVSWRQL